MFYLGFRDPIFAPISENVLVQSHHCWASEANVSANSHSARTMGRI